jgi:hypothetical protein
MSAAALTAPARAVYRFWVRPLPAEPLALFRIAIGCVVVASVLLSMLPRLARDAGGDYPLLPIKALGEWPDDTGRWSLLYGPPRTPLVEGWADKTGKDKWDAKGHWDVWYAEQGWADGWKKWARRPSSAYLLFALWALSAVLLTVGLFTRTSAVLCWALTVTFHVRLDWALNGGDALFRCGLFYLMFARSGAAWSLDAWLSGRQDRVPAWPVRLLQLQIIVVYFFTGMCKVTNGFDEGDKPYIYDQFKAWVADTWLAVEQGGPALTCVAVGVAGGLCGCPDGLPAAAAATRAWASDFGAAFGGGLWALLETVFQRAQGQDWLNGEAVYWVLNDTALNRFPYWAVPIPMAVCRLLSWGTLLFEIGFPFFLLSRYTRPALLLGGAAFHFGIWLHTEVGYFSAASVSFYALFLSGPTAAFLLGLPGRLFRRRPAPAPGTWAEPEPEPSEAVVEGIS